jgi:hypothetical protein
MLPVEQSKKLIMIFLNELVAAPDAILNTVDWKLLLENVVGKKHV